MKSILQFAILLFISVQLVAQQKEIYGKVTSAEDQLPLPGVNVVIKGTTTGTQTDFDGFYKLNASEGDQLVFSYVGMVTAEVMVGKNVLYNVELEVSKEALEEVVITSYGYSNKRHVTGAASTVSNSLQGKVSGVQITNSNGQPGPANHIKIRGYSSVGKRKDPLIIVNGNPSSYNSIQQIDSDNIENVTVLKDASATAIYGNRAANGVVIISTKDNEILTEDATQYIVDGVPIPKINNDIIERLPESAVDSKVEYDKKEAKKKFGRIAKNGCVVITTCNGNFRIENQETYSVINENQFERVQLSPLSTFSIDVDKASYSNVRRMINNGESINPDAVKIEEMVNYFDYEYPEPTGQHPFAIHTEYIQTPWHQDTKLVKIGLQGKTYRNEEFPSSNLTFLIDVSGSMSSQNKLPLLKSAFKLLVNQLREEDMVSIVVYAGAAGTVLEPTSGRNKEKILSALNKLESGGSTAGGAGIQLAYQLAEKNFKKKGNNRVILATDGDFNVGASSDKAMEKLIEEKRKTGVFLSVLGFGYGNYKDSKLETLADKGNGNHAYIDTMQEAQKVFGKEFGGTLYTIAKDVKIQVEFNPSKVQAYRLIGYENRLLNDEDFKDDTKDAGELGSGHTVTALYELVPTGVNIDYLKDVDDLKYTKSLTKNNDSNELLTVKFRYKKPDENTSIEMVHVQKDELKEPSEDISFAASVALFGMQLRGSKFFNDATIGDVVALAEKGRGKDKEGYRAEFIRLVNSYQNL